MKKKIYTFTLIIFAALLLLYSLWALAANIQKEAFRQYLSDEWSFSLSEEKISIEGFPFQFGIKVSNFQSPIEKTPLTLEFSKLEIVRLIYNLSDIILFLDKPVITNIVYPKLSSSSNKLKISISDKPFSGGFRLISEQEDWQISNDNFLNLEAKKVIFALKDADEMKLDFFFQADDLGSSFLNKNQERSSREPNKLILRGKISNNSISKEQDPHKVIKLDFIILEKLEMSIGFSKLSCNEMVAINIYEFTTEGDVDCFLTLSYEDISKIKTNNETIQNVIELIKFISIFKNQTKSAEPQAIPIKISLNKGSLYINKIPIYQFPIKY